MVRQEALVGVELDHFPILLDTTPFKCGPYPFRFENKWLSHKEFLGSFENWWEESDLQGWEGFKFMKKIRKCET